MLCHLNFTRYWANQFDRPNNSTGHLLHTKPFTRNFELLSVYISVQLRWYSMNQTSKSAHFQPVENSSLPVWTPETLKFSTYSFWTLLISEIYNTSKTHFCVDHPFYYIQLLELQTDGHRGDPRKCPYSNEVSVLCGYNVINYRCTFYWFGFSVKFGPTCLPLFCSHRPLVELLIFRKPTKSSCFLEDIRVPFDCKQQISLKAEDIPRNCT